LSSIRHNFQFDCLLLNIVHFIHPLLNVAGSQKSLPIPLAVFIHELKTKEDHQDFWLFLKRALPVDLAEKCFVVTDCEYGIRSAIKKQFENIQLLRCWKHLFGSKER
jgi:hypothetical protein